MSTREAQKFSQILKINHLHETQARRILYEALLSGEPISIQDLVKKTVGQLDRVSIYRNVDLFEKIGIVHRVSTGWKYKIELSDAFIGHHHHVTCEGCGQVTDVQEHDAVNEYIVKLASLLQFKVTKHELEISGYCRNCQPSQV
jgi:Fe2+ or Zn2+ uptake regulation protein